MNVNENPTSRIILKINFGFLSGFERRSFFLYLDNRIPTIIKMTRVINTGRNKYTSRNKTLIKPKKIMSTWVTVSSIT